MQPDAVDEIVSTVVCLLVTDKSIIGPTRIQVAATKENGLLKDCFAMAELDEALRFALGLAWQWCAYGIARTTSSDIPAGKQFGPMQFQPTA